MDNKTFNKLELNKILDQLATYAAFSASRELIEELEPTTLLDEARRRQQETSEARDLLEEHPSVSVGGARDVRPYAGQAERGIMLSAAQLLELHTTLRASAYLKEKIEDTADYTPLLQEIAQDINPCKSVTDAISTAIGDDGAVRDSASPELAQIRHDLKLTHDRLHTKLQSIVNSSANSPYLQEAIITQRAGRYVIPVKAEAKGRIKGIVHETSASGATVYMEPMATVEINNRIRELESAEQEEVERILRELSAQVGDYADPIIWSVEAMAELDAAFARAKYASALNATSPELVGFADDRNPGSTVRLYNARHPLIPAGEVVPIDIELDDSTYMLVITGPNTGGKTVSLKTVGLLILMAQCGLHIPASGESMLTVFDSVFADIGDEQSIEQSLSTFSAHMNHIISILDNCDHRSLVLLDELGSGTDPAEGASIARAIMEDLRVRGVTCFVATHYPELKLYAHSTAGVRNASMEFDVETLSPTYRLILGLPGRSNALAIASRLGLEQSIIDAARSYIGADDLAADDLLDEIHHTREETRRTHDRLSAAERDASILRDRLQERMDQIEEQRQNIIEGARAEAEEELDALRAEIKELRKRLRAIPPTYQAEADAAREALEAVEQDAESVEGLIDEPVQRSLPEQEEEAAEPARQASTPHEDVQPGELEIGDLVFVPSLSSEGEVVGMDGGEAEVQVGQFRVRVAPDELQYRSRRQSKKEQREKQYASPTPSRPQPESPGLEIHLRGYTVEEALPELEEYLDQAYLSGLPWVRIVHGKGTGILRDAVRDTLNRSPLVESYKKAKNNQGGDGVTVVHFVPLM